MVERLLLVFQFLQTNDGWCYFGGVGCIGRGTSTTRFMQEPQCQISTSHLFILILLQKEQVYWACWLISIFFTIFLREATIRGPIFTDHSNLLGVFNHVPHKLSLTAEGDLCIFRVLHGAWHLGALQGMFMNENPGIENKFYNKLQFPLSENCFRLKFWGT